MKHKKYYITAAIPYVNAAPHIGHALEFVQANVIARYHRLVGDEVMSLCGGDENALKNVQAAESEGKPIQDFVDENTEKFRQLAVGLDAVFDVWQKGSDKEKHHRSSQTLWKLCEEAGDIYQKEYEGLYCLGCEAFYDANELDIEGECPEHKGKRLERVIEKNYFFRLSKYQNELIRIIENDELKIVPESRKNEVLAFLKSGLKDISISRSNERAKDWGVQVPGDESQRMYVWFDALNIYQSGIGFGWDDEKYNRYWPADLHVIGKGILRFHAVYWPAFLLSAGLKLPKSIFVHEYFTVNGQKMSKTLGNVCDPIPLIEKYSTDGLRYYCLAKMNPFSDGDFNEEKLANAYNADLANGLGNLVSRVATLCERSGLEFVPDPPSQLRYQVKENVETFRFDLALGDIWNRIGMADKMIEKEKPWSQKGSELKRTLTVLVAHIRQFGFELQPFLPKTADQINRHFYGPVIKKIDPLFPRLG